MRYRTNMEGVEEGGTFTLIPESIYNVKVYSVDDRVTKNGDPMVAITLTIIDDDQYAGARLWDNIVIPEPDSPSIKIKGRTKHFLHCIGMPHEGDLDNDSEDWIGRQTKARVIHELYEGKPRAKIGEYILDEELQKQSEEVDKIPF